jgi:putative two-component system response regulator
MSKSALIPFSIPEPDASKQWRGNPVQLTEMKILIVDDDSSNVALLEAMLSDAGFTHLKSVLDSRLALDICQTFEPDLLLLDLMMPHVDGFTLLESLRTEAGEVFLPIIVLTADVDPKSKLRALRTGATDFLLKPLDEAEVLARITNVLESRRLQQLLESHRANFETAVRTRTAELRTALWDLESMKNTFVIL